MSLEEIVRALDVEIARLQEVRALLSKGQNSKVDRIVPAAEHDNGKRKTRRRRTLSPEARQRIADAQRKRWAAQKRIAK